MFYFRFENLKTQKTKKKIEQTKNVIPYQRWKGTIFSRKIRKTKKLELVPSEFMQNL